MNNIIVDDSNKIENYTNIVDNFEHKITSNNFYNNNIGDSIEHFSNEAEIEGYSDDDDIEHYPHWGRGRGPWGGRPWRRGHWRRHRRFSHPRFKARRLFSPPPPLYVRRYYDYDDIIINNTYESTNKTFMIIPDVECKSSNDVKSIKSLFSCKNDCKLNDKCKGFSYESGHCIHHFNSCDKLKPNMGSLFYSKK